MALLHIDLDWCFEYEVAGTILFQSDITVHLAVEGMYGSDEITGWTIEGLSTEGYDSIRKRPTRHHLPDDSEGVKLIVATLNADKAFDSYVRERALAEAEAA